ncbi:formate dehydrogenase accessory sulfurtransferase FdhD [Metapseudomonas boanensis]|uniref:Sulfur carrier protein FdhD n=1 Tax=Metapseudomonas boanensis TaxID=2822138 RepID=A0ABS5XH17_9GAMM|nr:formate dehydrogenase accessory sulfurtransferase FdhD [Pseudomonas boanensis]
MPRPGAKRHLSAVSMPPPPMGYAYAELDQPACVKDAVLAEECALAIAYNGISHAVMMVSPSALEDFITGFSLSSGIIQSIDEIYDIQIHGEGTALRADVQISNRAFWSLKEQRRQLAGTTGCGLCGVEALEQALPNLQSLVPAPLPPAEHLHELRPRIAAAQDLARHSGALHAALFVDAAGELHLCREDIGRHNALDKLIGALLREGIEPREGFAVVTSRCSLELIHKAVRAGLATLVSLSAPTTLTVQWARQHHLNLIHLPHHSAPRVYSPAPPPQATIE